MAITITYKSSVYTTANTAATYTCAPTWTPASDALVLAFVCTTYSASPTDPTSVTGHGLSYSKLTLGTSTLSTTHKLSAWIAKTGSSPTSVACVANCTTTNGTGGLVIEFEITGADVTGTALQAIVDSTASNTGSAGTSATVTLASPANADNRAATFIVQLSNAAPTTAGSWTLTAGAAGNFNTPATGGAALFRNDAFDTAGAATKASGISYRMVGVEVKIAPAAPTVTTDAVTGIQADQATGGGNVTADGGASVTERGVVWNTSTGPTTADFKTASGSGTGTFQAAIAPIVPLTHYYVRAYAINSVGTSYGNEVEFDARALSLHFNNYLAVKVAGDGVSVSERIR